MSQFLDLVRLPNFGLGVSKGQFQNISHIHKFGAVPAMSVNTTGTIWDVNDTAYPWSAFASAGTLSLTRASASDADKVVVLVGLDENYAEITESVTLTAASGNVTTQSFIRIFRAYMTTGSNVGNIDVIRGATTVARINANKSQTLMAIYTIPAGKTGYLLQGTCSCQSGADATGDMFVRYFGQASFRVGHSFEVSGNGGQYLHPFVIPIRIPEKSDIDVRALVRSNNARVTAAFDLLLDEDN